MPALQNHLVRVYRLSNAYGIFLYIFFLIHHLLEVWAQVKVQRQQSVDGSQEQGIDCEEQPLATAHVEDVAESTREDKQHHRDTPHHEIAQLSR